MEGEGVPTPISQGDGPSHETAYIPVRVLGRGAFGEAILYRKVEDNSLVVWKEVDLRRLGDRERREAQNEIDILAMLNHDNIVSYYNHFLDGDMLLIEMEYANGGNLHEKIVSQNERFDEKSVLWYFYQIISGVAHIHEYGILHRDIKTLNIFLNKSGLVKLGDFGISRVLESTSEMAETYVGTPYYMSPELIRGDKYNQKSDIWAAGCVLYEMLTLSRVFDATNPLKLANDIVTCDIQEVDEVYSESIKSLLKSMLNKESSRRPSCDQILKEPFLESLTSDHASRVFELNYASRCAKLTSSTSTQDVLPVVTDKSSEVYYWGGGKLTPQNLEMFTKGNSAIQVSVGRSHFAVVTVEKELFTWASAGQGGSDIVGQLGHGDIAAYKAPKRVAHFEGVPIKQVSCGEDFTVCVTDSGQVYTFGSDYYGCLGCDGSHGDAVTTPVLLDFFTSRPVAMVSCGEAHVLALTREGEVYSWGCGEYGRLGLGSESDFSTPQRVTTRGRHGIKSVVAATDGSFMVKTNGRVLACGSNEHNKLGLNSTAKGLKRKEEISYDIPCKYTFSIVKPLSKYNIVSVSAGRTHTAAIDYIGHLITFGCNTQGQLGLGDYRPHTGVHQIYGVLTGQRVTRAVCGDGFTVAATNDNSIYSWGLADNGRLGTKSSEGRKGPGGSCPGGACSAIPRPIFGSLHVVSDLCCYHWSTIMVAEKVLAQKTIRSTSVLSSKESSKSTDTSDDPFEFRSDLFDAGPRSPSSMSTRGAESFVPDWLKAELADSEFIPAAPHSEDVSGSSRQQNGNHSNPAQNQESIPPSWLAKELEEAEFIPAPHSDPTPVLLPYGVKQTNPFLSEGATNNPFVNMVRSQSADGYVTQGIATDSSPTTAGVCVTQGDAERELSLLRAELERVRTENCKLEGLVNQQASTIRTQAYTITHLEDQCKFKEGVFNEIWGLVDTWQDECMVAMGRKTPPVLDNQPQPMTTTVVRTTSNNNFSSTPRLSREAFLSLHEDLSLDSSTDSESESSVHSNPTVSSIHSDPTTSSSIHSDQSDVVLPWDNLGSPDETKTWSKSSKRDMLKSFLPGKIMQKLKGVTTTEEVL